MRELCDICLKSGEGKDVTALRYDDFFGYLCEEHYDSKVRNATVNPWTGKPK